MKKFRRQWNVNHIYSSKNSEMKQVCRKWRNRFKREKFVALAEYLEQQTEYCRYKKIIRKSTRSPYQTNGNHSRELSTVGHTVSEQHWKSTFNFTEIINNCWLKRRTVSQIVKVISHFSLKLYIQYWKYFYSMVLGSERRDYSKKIRC